MSDFDKEAERRRLREKYEKDQQKRQSTQRMSELLLKGATMTNTHCDTCGDPLFRYDGQEFCPTCNAEAGGDRAAGEADGEAGRTADAADVAGDTTGDGEATQTADAEASVIDDARETADAATATPPDVDASGVSQTPTNAGRDAADRHPEPSPRTAAQAADSSAEATRTGEESVAAARASLVRTLTRFARRAEETDDPRRATEFLAAAREAAEALAALE